MKTSITLLFFMLTSIALAQSQKDSLLKTNEFRIQLLAGVGLGFNNVDLFEDEDGGKSSISGGGGLHIGLNPRYIYNRTFELSLSVIYHSSILRPQLSNVSTSFNRFSFEPTAKYLISISKEKDQTINIGLAYGFYTNPKLKVNGGNIGASANLNYENASGINFLTEYEVHGTKRLSYNIGLKYYGVSYDIKNIINENDLDKFKGSGIDLYFGLSYRL